MPFCCAVANPHPPSPHLPPPNCFTPFGKARRGRVYGAIYTGPSPTPRPGPDLCSVRLGLAERGGRCVYICDLDQTWITSLTSLSLQTCHLSAILPDSSVLQPAGDVSGASLAQPNSGAEPESLRYSVFGRAESSRRRPAFVLERPSVNTVSTAQPGHFRLCKWWPV